MATAQAGERNLDVLKNIGDMRSSRSPMKHEVEGEGKGGHSVSSDLLAPVRFNILGQMQIHGKTQSSSPLSHSNTQGLMNQISSAFSLHPGHPANGLGSTHLRNRNSHISTNNNNNNRNSRPCTSSPEPESPLDFSTKKAKLENPRRESAESPSSRLRNILSMKSPSISEDLAGTALNLSKESPSSSSSVWSKSESRGSLTSSPLSPSMENPQTFIHSPRPATIPVSVSSSGPMMFSTVGNGATPYPLSFSPWGNGVFSPSLSPILNQAAVPTGAGLPMTLDTSAAMFPHQITIATANTSPGGTHFSSAAQMHINGAAPISKTKATRPFKAYPKDPMTFSSVGLYGLPMGPAPGGTEALLHQQSNQAYAEFRKQMLASSQLGRTRRVGQKSGGHGESDSSNENEGLSFGISMDSDTVIMADSSPENDLSNGKSRLGKSEQQMKDEAYWERRRKNNEAAKRSRDARRAKEDEIAIRAAFLEQENLKLRFELCALKNETAKLRCIVYSS